jgi:hypothetical protein
LYSKESVYARSEKVDNIPRHHDER